MEHKNSSNENYDLAISFSGKDRELVEQLVREIQSLDPKIKIFYDEDHSEKLIGQELFEYLRQLYAERSKYVMCIFSENYSTSNWVAVEKSAIKDRLFLNFMDSNFLIPIFLDVSATFLPATIGYWDWNKFSVQKLAEMTVYKVNTGIGIDLEYTAASDIEDLAYLLRRDLVQKFKLNKIDYDEPKRTDDGYQFVVHMKNCNFVLNVGYKIYGINALVLRYEFQCCAIRRNAAKPPRLQLACNAYVSAENGGFLIHNFDMFDDLQLLLPGEVILAKIEDKIISIVGGNCSCLF